MPPLLDAALALAAKGFRVFPLRPRAKVPVRPNPFQHASCRPDAVRRAWAGRGRNSNVGVHLPGVLVLDIDGAAGEQSFRRLAAARPVPATAEVATGNGGRHLYYRLPPGRRAVPRPLARVDGYRGDAFVKIDIKGSGGLVVGPGSVHKSGAAYAWTREPADLDALAPAPDWMLHDLCGPEDPKYLVEIDCGSFPEPGGDDELRAALVARFPLADGTRHAQTGRAACWLLGRGLTQEKAQKLGVAWLLAFGRDDDEARSDLIRTLARAYAGLESGDTYLMTDHQQRTIDNYATDRKKNRRAQNAFCALRAALSAEEALFVEAVKAHVLYEATKCGGGVDGVAMTHRQLMRVYELLHGRTLCWKALCKNLAKFVTNGHRKAGKEELMVTLSLGRFGTPSRYKLTGLVLDWKFLKESGGAEGCADSTRGRPGPAVRRAARPVGREAGAEGGPSVAGRAARSPAPESPRSGPSADAEAGRRRDAPGRSRRGGPGRGCPGRVPRAGVETASRPGGRAGGVDGGGVSEVAPAGNRRPADRSDADDAQVAALIAFFKADDDVAWRAGP